MDELPRYFRAFDFLSGERRTRPFNRWRSTSILRGRFPPGVRHRRSRAAPAGFDISKQPDKLAAINKVLDRNQGTLQFVTLVDRFNLTDRYPQVVAILEEQPDTSLGVDVVKMLVAKTWTAAAEGTPSERRKESGRRGPRSATPPITARRRFSRPLWTTKKPRSRCGRKR